VHGFSSRVGILGPDGVELRYEKCLNRYNFKADIASFLTVGIAEMGANALFFSESLIFMQGPADIKFSNILKIKFPIFSPG